ncbi:hypothetical protein LNP74_32620 [Klebsiella pneumoniae subsp. pneumoniae]|nr:hypothetical protein [Klebsiella pneumoniae subsp. pneumoniae]
MLLPHWLAHHQGSFRHSPASPGPCSAYQSQRLADFATSPRLSDRLAHLKGDHLGHLFTAGAQRDACAAAPEASARSAKRRLTPLAKSAHAAAAR